MEERRPRNVRGRPTRMRGLVSAGQAVNGPEDPAQHEVAELGFSVDLLVVTSDRIERSAALGVGVLRYPDGGSRRGPLRRVRHRDLGENLEPRYGFDVAVHDVPLVTGAPRARQSLEDGMIDVRRFKVDRAGRLVIVVVGKPATVDVVLEP